MKLKITMKDPDILYDVIEDSVSGLKIEGLDAEELEAVKQERKAKLKALCEKWFEDDEYLTVEVDTEKNTCIVIPVR